MWQNLIQISFNCSKLYVKPHAIKALPQSLTLAQQKQLLKTSKISIQITKQAQKINKQIVLINNKQVLIQQSYSNFFLLELINSLFIFTSLQQSSFHMQTHYWQDVRKHQINTSSSKYTFGFPKQQRFRSNSKVLCDSFYNIPSAIGKSPKPGIGLGKKVDLVKRNDSPSPNKYNAISDFDLTKKNLSMGKFALGRDKMKVGGIFTKNENPPPGNYEVRSNMLLKNSISMHPKLSVPKKSNEFNPGPGHYSSLNTLNATGKYIVSTVINTPGTRIKSSKMYDPAKSRIVPGPGAYNTDKQNLNTTGNFFNSRHQSSRCRTFSKSQRKDESITSRRKLPGPGAYNFFSDFGSKMRK